MKPEGAETCSNMQFFWFQTTVTLLECSIIQSSPPDLSNLLLHTLVSCWPLQENSRATWPRAVAFLHGKHQHINHLPIQKLFKGNETAMVTVQQF